MSIIKTIIYDRFCDNCDYYIPNKCKHGKLECSNPHGNKYQLTCQCWRYKGIIRKD